MVDGEFVSASRSDLARAAREVRPNLVERQVTARGIFLYGLRYDRGELARLSHHGGHSTRVRVAPNPADIGGVLIAHPACRSWFEVPALPLDYAEGLSLGEHQETRRAARAERASEGGTDAPRQMPDEAGAADPRRSPTATRPAPGSHDGPERAGLQDIPDQLAGETSGSATVQGQKAKSRAGPPSPGDDLSA